LKLVVIEFSQIAGRTVVKELEEIVHGSSRVHEQELADRWACARGN
jgi:hypothetical protein